MTAPPRPLEPVARLTADQANALRVLARNVQAVSVEWGGRPWQMSLRPLMALGAPPAAASEWCIGLTWSGLPFELVVPEAGAQAWIQAAFPALDLPALPRPFVAAAFENACASLVVMLPGGAQDRVRVEQWSPAAEGRLGLPHAFLLEMRTGEAVMRAQLSTSTHGLLHMARLALSLAPARDVMDTTDLPMTLVAAVGMTWLGLDELAHLRPRDTILFDVRLLDQDGRLWIQQGDMGFRVQREGEDLVVTEEFMDREWTVSPKDETGAARAELSALEHLPLRVVFDLGELSMTLGELKSLQVGQPLALARPLASAVNLRVNGALIGTGELVEIEGELGVTITSLFQRPAGKTARVARAGGRRRPQATPETPEEVTP